MVAFNRKTEGVKQVSTHLSPRGNRTNSGQVHSSWVGVSAPQNAATSLSATPANTSVSIAFTPPTDNGGMTITNYQYAISSNGGSTYSAYAALSPADGVSPITVTGLTQNTAYLIKLKAVNDVGVSDVESSPVSFTSQGVPTSAPSSLSSTQTNTTATISFTAAASSTSITNYEYSFNNSSWTALSPADAASPVTITGLTQNTAYTVYLRGVNSYGSGPGSTGLSLTTQGVPTSAPSSLSAIPVNTSVAISFTAAASSTALTNYEYSFNNSSWTALSPADSVSPVTVSGLTQNTAYTVYLRGVNSYGSGPASTGVSFTTEGVPTGTATITSVPVGTTTATVNFSVAAGGGAITGYDLYITNFTNAWNNATASPISVTGLTPNTLYTFYVRAKNAYGVGPQSAGVNATTNPTFISATGGTTLDYASGGFTYRSHTFAGNGTFTVSSVGSFGTVDVHLVGGVGGGGWSYGGGGGGGGGRTQTSVGIAATGYSVVVGGAGTNAFNAPYTGVAGGTSTVMGFSAGGGGGGSSNVTGPSATPANGSGGGGNLNQIAPGGGSSYGSAGNPTPGNGGGSGGSGFNQPNNYRTGSNETYAVGGGGSGYAFGGAAGTTYGCGGGGGSNFDQINRFGGAPVAGVVIIRYRIA